MNYLFKFLLLTAFVISFSAEYDKYIDMAWKTLPELLKTEGDSILNYFEKNKDTYNINPQLIDGFRDIRNKVGNNEILNPDDYHLIIHLATAIGMKSESGCYSGVFVNPLTYALRISAMQTENRSVYLSAYIPIDHVCLDVIKKFCGPLRDVTIKKGLQLEYVLHCLSEDDPEHQVMLDKVKGILPRAVILGDKNAKRKLLEMADGAETFDEKIKIIELLGEAGSQESIKRLLLMLDDTTEIRHEDGRSESIRYFVLRQLRKSYCTEQIFTCEFNKAYKADISSKNNENRKIVNKFFQKVALWCKENFNIELENLIKYDYLNSNYWGHGKITRFHNHILVEEPTPEEIEKELKRLREELIKNGYK
ncbi:hypothetical protein CHISP_3626 [Chitinispirillum alkaliphilum]|nr:hypothetical protein CHISP_3626 [Chitinispirillum alkaliphilum]